ncbi:MAG: PaaI family thioesterase [Alphaproteobacteria bacterium]
MVVHTTIEAFTRLIEQKSAFGVWLGMTLEAVGAGTARMRLPYREEFLRPGGAIHGPIIMAIADYAMYAALMGLSPRGENGVTSNLNMYFLKKSSGKDLIADARTVRGGARTSVIEVSVYSDGDDDPVAFVTGTYVIPSD